MRTSSVKIIAGTWRGRKVLFPELPGCRPTAHRIRETLFNWLMHDIQGSRCLDCFAGSGALGFEALSRGAASVCFVEKNHQAAGLIQEQIHAFSCQNKTHVLQASMPVEATLLGDAFNVIFLDPPYDADLWTQCLTWIEAHQLLKPEGVVYFEAPQKANILPFKTMHKKDHWFIQKHKKTKTIQYGLLSLAK